MKTFKTTLIALATAVPALAFSLPSQAAMSPYMKTALVDVCKAAMSNKVYRLSSTTKSYNLKDKTIALKVVCNGDDIISFAERHGADKTAAKLQKSIGNVSIIDTASTAKLNVTFTE
ncbi:MAG: DUF3718 domain-containing protein [Colwellia sp.]|nr:DUF3718 domain-containing protein [Colwellia sp.]MCW8865325.1 DUF3718 domain-containing protein [Colwellia sp.]MCW9080346.1 DUF3718 domain-containing protein [Colwellia sp.]